MHFWKYCLCQSAREKRFKLDDKGEKCILLGYAENSSGYKLHNPITKKVIFSRDVEFDKSQYGIDKIITKCKKTMHILKKKKSHSNKKKFNQPHNKVQDIHLHKEVQVAHPQKEYIKVGVSKSCLTS